MARHWMLHVGALGGLLAAAACAGNGTGLDENGHPLGTTTGCGDSVCLSTDVQPILTANCAVAGCHAGTSPQQGMNLSDGLTHQAVVNVAANERAGMKRVLPFAPDSSYLVHKIQGTQASVGGLGERMPLGQPPLSQAQITLIRAWIAAGAKNN